MADTSAIRNENIRRPLEPLKQNVLSLGRRPSCSDFDLDKSEARRYKLVLQEKDKQLVFLEQQLLITQSRVEELQVGSDKHKRQEREAKKSLSSKESHLRRQTIALKHTNDKLQCYVLKEDDKIRRSKMERKELQEELERMEDEYTDQQIKNNMENKALEDIIVTMRDENSFALANQTDEFNARSGGMAEQFAADLSSLSKAVMDLKDQTADLVFENCQLQSQVGMLSADASNSMMVRESHLKNISFLETLNKDSNTEFMYQNVELVRMTLRNAFLQNLVEELSIEKQSLKSEKDNLLAEYEMQSQERTYKLNQENIEKRDQLICNVAEISKLNEEYELQTSSVTELWKSLRAVQLSERNLKIELDQARKLISVAHNEINTKIFSLKVLGEVKCLLEADIKASADRIDQLVSSQQLVEEKLQSSHSNLLMTTENYNNTKIELLEEKEKTNMLTIKLNENCLMLQDSTDNHINVMQSQQCVIDSLNQLLSKKDEEITNLNSKVNNFVLELSMANNEIKKIQIKRDDDKKFLNALKIRLKDTKLLLDESKNQNDYITKQCTSFKDKLSCNMKELEISNKENISCLSIIELAKENNTKLSNNVNESVCKIMELETTLKCIEINIIEVRGDLGESEKRGETLSEQLVASEKRGETLSEQLVASEKRGETLSEQLVASEERGDTLIDQLVASEKRGDTLSDQLNIFEVTFTTAREEHLQSIKENQISYSLLSDENQVLSLKVLEVSSEVSALNATLCEHDTILKDIEIQRNLQELRISDQIVDIEKKTIQIESYMKSNNEINVTLQEKMTLIYDLKNQILRMSDEAVQSSEILEATILEKVKIKTELVNKNRIFNDENRLKIDEHQEIISNFTEKQFNLENQITSNENKLTEMMTANEENKKTSKNIIQDLELKNIILNNDISESVSVILFSSYFLNILYFLDNRKLF